MEIVLSKTAKRINHENLNYILKKYGQNVLEQYILKTEKVFSVLSEFPKAGIFESKYDFYKILIIKQIYLLYRIRGNKIIIMTFWNNKKKPFWN